MTASAPAAIAFAMSPEDVSPPSAITGTPCSAAAREHSSIAVTCGTPTPATIRVVQIDPGPTPIFTASAPASISASVASAVATLPTTSSIPSKRRLQLARHRRARRSSGRARCRAPARPRPPSRSASARSSASGPTPTAAATRSRPWSSFVACGIRDALRDVLDGDQPAQHAVRIHDGQLLDLVAVEDPLGFLERRPLRRSDEPLARHQLRDRPLGLAVEAQVAVGEDADEPAAFVRDGNAGDAVTRHQLQRVGDTRVRPQRHRLDDHPRLRPLNLVHLGRLVGDREVAVHDADAADARERDRHSCLRNRVHGGRDERDAQLDRPREAGRGGDVVRENVRLRRLQQHVVEGQAFARELRLERQQSLDPAELEIRMHLLRQVRMNGSSATRRRRPRALPR